MSLVSCAERSASVLLANVLSISVGLLEIVKNCTYVGMADEVFALVQHNTRLYLVNVVNIR